MANRPRSSPKEMYEEARIKAREGNISFLMASWTDLLGDQAFEPVSLEDIVEAFMTKHNHHSELEKLEPEIRELALSEVKSEMEACVSHWVEHGTLETFGTADGHPGVMQYRLTEYGKGFIKGFDLGAQADGKVTFQVIKKLTDEQVEKMGEEARAEVEAARDVCPGCGEVHEENPLDEIARMMAKRRKSPSNSDIAEILSKMMRGQGNGFGG